MMDSATALPVSPPEPAFPVHPAQRGMLDTLARAGTPLSSVELRYRMGIPRDVFQAASNRLRKQQYIASHIKRVRMPAFQGSVCKPIAFWVLTEKGLAVVRSTVASEA